MVLFVFLGAHALCIDIPETQDAYNRQTWRSFVATLAINPTNWTRSYARSAYINPLLPRNDVRILLNALVIRLLFQNGSEIGQGISILTASTVEHASSPIFARYSVRVNKEVMLVGRAIGSPTILMQARSGIEPRDVLQTASEVQVASDLPGIEQHLQDCIVRFIYFPF